jgi:hypothetical protein
MNEILDLFAGSTPAGPAPVPAVVYHVREYRRRVVGECRPCAHCVMNQARWWRCPKSIPQWRTKHDIVTHHAVVLITKVDGSALELCAQHVREYDGEQGARDG